MFIVLARKLKAHISASSYELIRTHGMKVLVTYLHFEPGFEVRFCVT